MRRSVGRAAIYGVLVGLATAAVAEAVRPRGGTAVLVDWQQVRRAAAAMSALPDIQQARHGVKPVTGKDARDLCLAATPAATRAR